MSTTPFVRLGTAARYEVVHDKVVLRASPSTHAPMINVAMRGDLFRCAPFAVDGVAWLKVDDQSLEEQNIVLPKGTEDKGATLRDPTPEIIFHTVTFALLYASSTACV